jgi:hypothetical protein
VDRHARCTVVAGVGLVRGAARSGFIEAASLMRGMEYILLLVVLGISGCYFLVLRPDI